MYIGFYVQYSLLLSDLNETRTLLTEFWKKAQILILIKIFPVGAEFLCANRQQTNMTNLIVNFHNFANVPETIKLKFSRGERWGDAT
jgi:hypothetical protein